ncbi:hypothetical protein [Agromyces sp. SYSU T00194]|uniref:hypothetical protein n=1 Tax=Agromyces chitinivorans TaxID=3158560 RepID=UPI003391336A
MPISYVQPTVVAGTDHKTDAGGSTKLSKAFVDAFLTAIKAACDGVDTNEAAIALLAPLASPAFTGNPTAPTPSASDNDTSIATTAFVQAALAALVDSSPAALDTLNELAAALGDDPAFATTVTNALALKAPLASPALTGTPTAPTQSSGTDSTAIASTAFVQATRGEYVGVNAQTGTTYTPVLSDRGKLVTLSNAGAITVTLPQDSSLAFPVGGRIDFAVLDTGMATFSAGTGATVNGTPSAVTRAQYSAVTAIKIAANTWLIVGDLETP